VRRDLLLRLGVGDEHVEHRTEGVLGHPVSRGVPVLLREPQRAGGLPLVEVEVLPKIWRALEQGDGPCLRLRLPDRDAECLRVHGVRVNALPSHRHDFVGSRPSVPKDGYQRPVAGASRRVDERLKLVVREEVLAGEVRLGALELVLLAVKNARHDGVLRVLAGVPFEPEELHEVAQAALDAAPGLHRDLLLRQVDQEVLKLAVRDLIARPLEVAIDAGHLDVPGVDVREPRRKVALVPEQGVAEFAVHVLGPLEHSLQLR